jgi:hypothetical protein
LSRQDFLSEKEEQKKLPYVYMGGIRKNLSLNRIPWEEMRRLMETDARVANEEMTSKLLKDGTVRLLLDTWIMIMPSY